MDNLPLQVGQVHGVEIDQSESANASRSQVHGDGRSQSAQADDQRMGLIESFLTVNVEFRQQDLPAVAQKLVVGHGISARERG